MAGVGALRHQPAGVGLQAYLVQQHGQGHPCPFTATRKAVARLRVRAGATLVLAGTVAGALDKVNAGNGRKATEVLHREDEGILHQAMDQQLMRGGIDRWHTRVMTLEMQRGWSDHAVRVLKRRPARAGCGSAGYAECACGPFERRAFSISAARSPEQVGLGSLCSTRYG